MPAVREQKKLRASKRSQQIERNRQNQVPEFKLAIATAGARPDLLTPIPRQITNEHTNSSKELTKQARIQRVGSSSDRPIFRSRSPRTSAERHKRSWGLAEFKAVVRTRRGSGLPGRIPQGSPRHPCRTRASNPAHHPSVLFFPVQCKQEHHAPGTANRIFLLFGRNRGIPSASLRMGDSVGIFGGFRR